MRQVWVIGSSGLLGSALRRALHSADERQFVPPERLAWADQPRLRAQLAAAVQGFSRGLAPGDSWEIYWAAGVGTFASLPEDVTPETAALAGFLDMLGQQEALRTTPGRIGFASSAGALYAGASADVITEHTPVAPTTPYAHAKLEQEALVTAYTERQDNVHALVARISTLYGAGQSFGKKQGLLSHIARSIVRNRPIQIYVPFDTIRDYITADDAAARIISLLRRQHGQPACRHVIVASENPTTIAEIVATFKRVSRRTPRVVTSVSNNTALYTRHVQFRSLTPAGPLPYPSTSLLVGIGQLLQAERFYFAQPARD